MGKHTYLDTIENYTKFRANEKRTEFLKKHPEASNQDADTLYRNLLELYESKDYGTYADKNGKIPVCFIGTNHTTGGNSGSPAIDAEGNLIGLNFDRVWEGTMSDINYSPEICRNIMVDARYVLFIVDKFAGATRLIDEMTLVHPKKK